MFPPKVRQKQRGPWRRDQEAPAETGIQANISILGPSNEAIKLDMSWGMYDGWNTFKL